MNEFVIRNGFTSKGGLQVTGSLIVLGGITGSCATASFAVSTSLAINAATASLTSLIDSSSYSNYSETSSYAYEAESVLNPNYNGWINPNLGNIGISAHWWYPINVASIAMVGNITQSLILAPVEIYKNCTVDKIISIFNHTTTGGAQGTSSFFIYSNSDRLLPQNKLFQSNVSGTTAVAITGSFSPTSSISLKAGEIYWLGVAVQNAVSIYPVYRASAVANTAGRVYNPILGVAAPNTASAYIQNITHYVLPISGNIVTSVPATASQNANEYSVIARNSLSPVLPYLIVI
jgi:hypothetical protein